MPFIPAPNVAQVEAVFQVDGQIVENVLEFQGTDLSETSLLALLDAVNAAIRTQVLPLLSSTLQLLRVVGQIIDAADGLVAISTASLPAAGSNSATNLPSNVTFCISKRTGLAGRSFRGRNYIPGIPENVRSSPNSLLTTYVTSLVAAWETVNLAAVDDGWVPVVVSRFSGGAPRTVAVVTPATAFIAVDNTLDSQRRRLPGRGS